MTPHEDKDDDYDDGDDDDDDDDDDCKCGATSGLGRTCLNPQISPMFVHFLVNFLRVLPQFDQLLDQQVNQFHVALTARLGQTVACLP